MSVLTIWMIILPCLARVNLITCHPHGVDKGYFWQITDFHYDENYTLHGDPSRMCHKSSSAIHYDLGKFGNFLCDSPWDLVQSSILGMSSIYSDPDFILWTGDNVPHVDMSTYDEDKVYTIIRNITDKMISVFPSTPIIPSFGNHDPYPSNDMPYHDPNYYSSILTVSHWTKMVPAEEHNNFIKGGYYSYDASPKLKIISLNTALYYVMNNLTGKASDPGGQFAWVTLELEKARLAHQKVYFAAHVPPGTFEMNPMFKWFHGEYNSRYMDLIDEYNDVIAAHFYGHEHSDSVRLYQTPNGYSPMFLSPSVTPYKGSHPGDHSNPAIRLYTYDRSTGDVLDYHQYFLNLSTANRGASGQWELEYEFTSAFDVPDLTASSVKQAAMKIVNGVEGKKYLNRYLKYNLISSVAGDCDESCIRSHRCSILYLRFGPLDKCLSGNVTSTSTSDYYCGDLCHLSRFMMLTVCGLCPVAVILGCLLLVVSSAQHRHKHTWTEYAPIPNYAFI